MSPRPGRAWPRRGNAPWVGGPVGSADFRRQRLLRQPLHRARLCGCARSRRSWTPSAVTETLRPRKIRPQGVEGYRLGEWVLMDYGDFVVHIFEDERRAFYGLDGLWGDTSDVTRDFCG